MSKPRLDLENMFTHHAPFGDQADRYTSIRSALKAAAQIVVNLTPESPEQTIAIRKLEEAMFYANAAIARNEVEC